jgi:hypothetical protein
MSRVTLLSNQHIGEYDDRPFSGHQSPLQAQADADSPYRIGLREKLIFTLSTEAVSNKQRDT